MRIIQTNTKSTKVTFDERTCSSKNSKKEEVETTTRENKYNREENRELYMQTLQIKTRE